MPRPRGGHRSQTPAHRGPGARAPGSPAIDTPASRATSGSPHALGTCRCRRSTSAVLRPGASSSRGQPGCRSGLLTRPRGRAPAGPTSRRRAAGDRSARCVVRTGSSSSTCRTAAGRAAATARAGRAPMEWPRTTTAAPAGRDHGQRVEHREGAGSLLVERVLRAGRHRSAPCPGASGATTVQRPPRARPAERTPHGSVQRGTPAAGAAGLVERAAPAPPGGAARPPPATRGRRPALGPPG
jgi:hypothetical protein